MDIQSGTSGGLIRIASLTIALILAIGCQPAASPPERGAKTEPPGLAPAPSVQAEPKVGLPATIATRPHSGAELYARHCAACHGDQGDGQGLAALFLSPKPRNLRTSSFRLISTTNGVPTREDIDQVLVRGMPGSAMPPWAHLTPRDRSLLVDEVLRIRREGARQEIIRTLKEEGEEEIREDDVNQFVESKTVPGSVLEVPPVGPPDAASIARGKELYVKQSCHSCHGNEGRGDGQQKMVDAEGFPTRPRDLTLGIYKGSPDPEAFYRRIALGLPGSPMPGSANLQPKEIIDLVHFLRSLSRDEQRDAAVMRRRTLKAVRAAVLPADAPGWDRVPAVAIKTVPLWWRDNAEPDLHVQAVHDGRTLALRLRWRDPTQNARAVLPDEFEDMVAAQWSATDEPFLGMGSPANPVDTWHWRAGMDATGKDDQLMDEYPFERELAADMPGGKKRPLFETAAAAGNPLATREQSGFALAAQGPGSVTFRPAISQLVQAVGQWRDGRWQVELTRPLPVPVGEGIALAPAHRYSIAFAVWDGAARERGGQKSVSIWNDLQLE